MNYERFGIMVTLIIVFVTCGLIGIAQLGLIDTLPIASIIPETPNSTYYNWCDKMPFEC